MRGKSVEMIKLMSTLRMLWLIYFILIFSKRKIKNYEGNILEKINMPEHP